MITDPKAFWAVSIVDSALDIDAMGVKEYLAYASSRDVSKLKFHPTAKPTRFELKRIPTSLFQRYVLEGRSEGEQHRRAFMCGVERVRDIVCADGETRAMMDPRHSAQTPGGPFSVWDEDQLELISPVYIEEMGAVAFHRSYLDPKARVYYPLPLSCQRVLERQLVFRVADETLPDAAPSSDDRREAQAPPPDVRGDEPTDVPAMDNRIDVSTTLPTPTYKTSSTLLGS